MEYIGKPAQQQEVIHAEIDAEQRHKYRAYVLQIRAVARHTVHFDAKSARSCGAEGSAEAVKQRHAAEQKENQAEHRHRNVDAVQDNSGILEARRQFADTGTGAFCPHQMQGAASIFV